MSREANHYLNFFVDFIGWGKPEPKSPSSQQLRRLNFKVVSQRYLCRSKSQEKNAIDGVGRSDSG
jgi:hypothetical protein